MLSIYLLIKILLTVALGVLLGMEREQTYFKANKEVTIGVRTFALIALFGFVSAMVGQDINGFWFV
ncbi:MgtC/SapB family protein [Patescibacteria group bacterium]|nr:MgtC/SapB family protein [Patescibacteria group bacterium]MBP7841095.1 MgtC/SapB family protein [Patescibacteria group bacterium]